MSESEVKTSPTRSSTSEAGILPVPGEDGKVILLFNSPGQSGPKLRTDGTVDYREMEGVAQVRAGALLARLQPPGPGFDGRDAHGGTLPAPPGKPALLQSGAGTRVSEDGQTLLAERDGAVIVKSGVISVSSVLELERGVDFRTGNIHFDGEVRVKGNVAEGFRIEAAGNILVQGDAEGAALISSGGNIQVTGGFFGEGKGSIQAKGEVKIAIARQAEIKCGTLIVEKAMQDCQVTTYGVTVPKRDCRIFGGRLLCFGTARLAQVGAEGCRTELVLRDEEEENMRAEKARLQALEAKEKVVAEELDRKLRSFKSLLAKSGNTSIPPKVAAEMKGCAETFLLSRRKLQNLNSEWVMIDQRLSALGDRKQFLSVAGAVEGNVHLDLLHFRHLLEARDGGREFLISKEKGLIDRAASALAAE